MDLNLKGKSALITGASRGIGFGVARVLASEGCNVHLASRSAADLESAKKKITDAYPVKVTCHAVDLGAEGSAEKLASEAGEIDFLVLFECDLQGYDPVHSLAFEFADPGIVAVVDPSPAPAGALRFQLRGLRAGATTVRMWLIHAQLHAIYETPPIPILVH